MIQLVKNTTRASAIFFSITFLYIIAVLSHGTYADFQPSDKIPVEPATTAQKSIIKDSILSFSIWNVGYGGLGAESDFFYDNGHFFFSGGKMVRSPKKMVEKNIAGAIQFLQDTQSDFFLLQEVDFHSKRSYCINQFEQYNNVLEGYSSFFAPNLNVSRIPLPLFEPWNALGKAHSGLGTFTRFHPGESTRYQLPGAFEWPTRIFQLDRCVSLHRFQVENGKELVVCNIHNSAYDKNGNLKKEQMKFLKQFFLEEYQKGNYVVAGGDWNQCPPGFEFDTFMAEELAGYSQSNIEAEFLPAGWKWAFDPNVPTNRKNQNAYKKGETFVTLIDFFLVSPNIAVKEVKGVDQGFQFSDHQPVNMVVELL